MSFQLILIDLWLRWNERPRLARVKDPGPARARLEMMARLAPMLRGAHPREAPLGRVPALRVAATGGAGPDTLLWIHGGAYCLGSPWTHVAMAAALAARAGLALAMPDYRLAPEHPFPAAPDDTLAAYAALLAEAPGRVVIGGDSAGGGLALALLHQILAAGLPGPAAVVVFSPWTDLTLSGASIQSLAWRDALLPAWRLPEIRDLYLAGADPTDPRASPVFGDFAGAPPVLIQASEVEILLDDARAMADRLAACGAAVRLDLWPAVPHVWQLFQGRLPEADGALDRAAAFLRRALAGPVPDQRHLVTPS